MDDEELTNPDELDDEEVEASDSEDIADSSDAESTDEEDANPVVRKADLDSLQAMLQTATREIGRLNSLENRLNKVEDPTERESRTATLQTQLADTRTTLAAVLESLGESEVLTPEAQRKLNDLLAAEAKRREREELKAELLKEVQPAKATEPEADAGPTWLTDAVRRFEAKWEGRVEGEGFDPDSADLKPAWQALGVHFAGGGTVAEAETLMATQLTKLKDERDAARSREQKKKSAGQAPRGGGTGGDESLASAAKRLQALGINI